MKKIGLVCLALACAIGGFATTAHAQNTSTWNYAGSGVTGYFHANPSDPVQWFQRVSTGAVHQFVMVQYGPDFIDLFDSSREVTIRLYQNACEIHHSGTGGRFVPLYNRGGALTPLASLLPAKLPPVTIAPVTLPTPGQPLVPAPSPGPEVPAPSPGPEAPAPSPGPEGSAPGATAPFLPTPAPEPVEIVIDD